MKLKLKLVLIIIIMSITSFPSFAKAISISPYDMTGLRSFNGGTSVLLLSFSAVKRLEDRTIAHCDISSLSGSVTTAILDIPVDNFDEGLPFGTFEVFSFLGDGSVSTDEWNAGTLFHTFTGIDGDTAILSTDVTSLLQDAIDRSSPFLSFNFRVGSGTDRYFLGSSVGLPEPTLIVVPEPSTIFLFGSGLIGVVIFTRRKKIRGN